MATVGDLVLAYILGLCVLELTLCGLDKSAARRGGRRVPEKTLLMVALAGGSPGLLLGMMAFRHKTRKASFLLSVGAIVLVHAGAIALWARLA